MTPKIDPTDTGSASAAGVFAVTSQPLTLPVIPGRSDTQAYKNWRFKSQCKVLSLRAKGAALTDITKFVTDVKDQSISFEQLHTQRHKALDEIDMSLYSALVNAADGSQWAPGIKATKRESKTLGWVPKSAICASITPSVKKSMAESR